MSNKPAPHPGNAPVLSDPNDVQEIFATELSGAQIGNGVAILTFGVARPMEQAAGKPPITKRVVVARLALPLHSVNDMMKQLAVMGQAIQQHTALARASSDKATAN